MEFAKVTSKGQITLPVNIRRKLGVKEDEDDIVAMIKQLQQERTAK